MRPYTFWIRSAQHCHKLQKMKQHSRLQVHYINRSHPAYLSQVTKNPGMELHYRQTSGFSIVHYQDLVQVEHRIPCHLVLMYHREQVGFHIYNIPY